MLRIVFGGPPNCGKSTLAVSLYAQMRRRGMSVGLHEIDVYSDTHDCILGKKPWGERRKRRFCRFDRIIRPRILEYASDTSDIVLGDLPGNLRNQFLAKMIAPADAAVVVGRDYAGMLPWEALFARMSIPVLVRVFSYTTCRPRALAADTIAVSGLSRVIVRSAELNEVVERLVAARTVRTKRAKTLAPVA